MDSKKGWIYLVLFVIFIFAGIYVKRGLGHPEFMMLFHLPAAVFLILGGYELTRKNRARYAKTWDKPTDSL